MGKAHPSSHAGSYIPNTVSLSDYPIASDIKPVHRILSLTHKKCWDKPDIRILPPLLQKNKYGRSQLYHDQLFSHTIYLYNRKFDWCFIVHPIWLVWHNYTSLINWSTEPPAHNIPDVPTKRFFFKKITQKSAASENWCGQVHFGGHSPEWRVLSKFSVQPWEIKLLTIKNVTKMAMIPWG